MTKAESKVVASPKWTKTGEYVAGIGHEYLVRVYRHETGATLQCNSWFGDSLLNMYGNVENIESKYELLDVYGLL